MDGSNSRLFRACHFFYKLVGYLVVVVGFFFSAGFLRYLGILLQSMSSLLFSCLFLKLAGWLFCVVLHLQSYSSFSSDLCVYFQGPGLLCWSVFSKDVVGRFSHGGTGFRSRRFKRKMTHSIRQFPLSVSWIKHSRSNAFVL